MNQTQPTPIAGISYYLPPADALLVARDGRVQIPYGEIPMPLLDEDHAALAGGAPSYDEIGRGIYQALRANPDCLHGDRYAELLRDAYPHYLSELASMILMLDRKEVEVAYLDRKVSYLKILALLEPDNPRIPLEIGATLMDKGLRLSALRLATVTLYRAESFLGKALQLAPEDVTVRRRFGEVCYILGKYADAAAHWCGILAELPAAEAPKLERRLQQLAEGATPRIPVVDYLEAVGVALDHYQGGEPEEAAAILQDVLDDALLCAEYPLPEVWYILGDCCAQLAMPRYAEEYLQGALKLRPDYPEARRALENLLK